MLGKFYELYNYNNSGNLISYITESWLEDTTWLNQTKHVYQYNENSQLTNRLEYYWDLSINNWVEYSQYKFSYDSQRYLSTVIEEDYSNGWIVKYKINYNNDHVGNTILGEAFDYVGNGWVTTQGYRPISIRYNDGKDEFEFWAKKVQVSYKNFVELNVSK